MNKKLLGVAVALFAGAAMAQSGNTGRVELKGTVQSTVSMSNASIAYVAPGSGPAPINNGATSPTAFDYTVDFGDINALTATDTAANGSSVRVLLTFEMRSNKAYLLQASNTDLLGAGASILTPAEIGFCTRSIANSANTAKIFNPATRVDAPTHDCRSTPNGTYDAVNDVVSYAHNLAPFTGPAATVLSGPQISTGGSVNSANNFIVVGQEFAIRPELFHSQGAFDYRVTYTASTP